MKEEEEYSVFKEKSRHTWEVTKVRGRTRGSVNAAQTFLL